MEVQVADKAVVVFNRNDPMWKCCCGTIHVKAACLVVGIARLTLLFGGVIPIFKIHQIGLGVFIVLAGITVATLLGVGFYTEIAYFLVPHMVWQILWCIFFGIVVVLFFIMGAVVAWGGAKLTDAFGSNDFTKFIGLGALMVFVVTLVVALPFALEVWGCVMVFRAFHYFLAYQNHIRVVVASAPPTYDMATSAPPSHGPNEVLYPTAPPSTHTLV